MIAVRHVLTVVALSLLVSACAGKVYPVAQVEKKPVKALENGKVVALDLTSTAEPSAILETVEQELTRNLVTTLGQGTFTKVVKADQPHDYKLAAVITDYDAKNPHLSLLGDLLSDAVGIEKGQIISRVNVDVDLEDTAAGGETITEFSVVGGSGLTNWGDGDANNPAIQQTVSNITVALTCINQTSSDPNIVAMCEGF